MYGAEGRRKSPDQSMRNRVPSNRYQQDKVLRRTRLSDDVEEGSTESVGQSAQPTTIARDPTKFRKDRRVEQSSQT